jgi:hypothetical protein
LVLSLDSLKVAQTLVLQDRARSLDLFDLMVLIRDHTHSIGTFFDNVRRLADGAQDGEIERLILRGLIPIDLRDEGLHAVNVHLIPAEMYAFFDVKLREDEVRIYTRHLREAGASNSELVRRQSGDLIRKSTLLKGRILAR